MNVSGVSSGASAAGSSHVAFEASLKVMKMAETMLEDTMGAMVESMSAIASGLGGNIDVYA